MGVPIIDGRAVSWEVRYVPYEYAIDLIEFTQEDLSGGMTVRDMYMDRGGT